MPVPLAPQISPAGPCRVSTAGDRLACAFESHPAHLATARRAVEAFCHTTGLDDAACDEVGLVVNEALANVIRHAYSGAVDRPVEVTADREGPGVRVTIRDWGSGRVPSPTDNPATADPLLPGGLGLICLKRLMDHCRFEPQPDGGMRLVLVRTTSGRSAVTG